MISFSPCISSARSHHSSEGAHGQPLKIPTHCIGRQKLLPEPCHGVQNESRIAHLKFSDPDRAHAQLETADDCFLAIRVQCRDTGARHLKCSRYQWQSRRERRNHAKLPCCSDDQQRDPIRLATGQLHLVAVQSHDPSTETTATQVNPCLVYQACEGGVDVPSDF
jgi:hypothetical protein